MNSEAQFGDLHDFASNKPEPPLSAGFLTSYQQEDSCMSQHLSISVMGAGNFWGVVSILLTAMGVWLVLHLLMYRRWLRLREDKMKLLDQKGSKNKLPMQFQKQGSSVNIFLQENTASKFPVPSTRSLKQPGVETQLNEHNAFLNSGHKDPPTAVPDESGQSKGVPSGAGALIQIRGDEDMLRGSTMINRDFSELGSEKEERKRVPEIKIQGAEEGYESEKESDQEKEDEMKTEVISLNIDIEMKEEQFKEDESEDEISSLPNVSSEGEPSERNIRVANVDSKKEEIDEKWKRSASQKREF